MTNLSPAAQAVHDAFWSHPNGEPLVQDSPDTDQLVAALRAAAIHLRSEEYAICNGSSYAMMIEVDDLLDLAAELEGSNG